MKLVRALYAFYRQLFGAECEHPHLREKTASGPLDHGIKGTFCPDCGYKVAMLWTMVRCRNCISKRTPRKCLDGSVGPLYRYCEHCGSTDYQVIKKQRLAAHEVPYAMLCADVDYSEERCTGKQYQSPINNRLDNPFAAFSGAAVVEGEVVHTEFVPGFNA